MCGPTCNINTRAKSTLLYIAFNLTNSEIGNTDANRQNHKTDLIGQLPIS